MNLRERLRTLRPAATARRGGESAAGSGLSGSEPVWSGVGEGASADGGGTGAGGGASAGSGRNIDFGPGVPVTTVATPAGEALCVEWMYDGAFKQGRVPLDDALRVPDKGWRRLLPMAEHPFPIEDALFIDLETTGLSRGPGTYPFLIGAGRFVGGRYRLRQYFMRDFDDEGPVLEGLRQELDSARAIVTFNGRAFDWPLLETRATMMRLPLPRKPHLDLLPPARRLWRSVLAGCRLEQLEEAVLGVVREGDVPGHAIPQRYFDYLQTGDGTGLVDVVVHNRLDILSMTALTGFVGRAVAAPRRFAVDGEALSAAELVAIGRWLLPDPEGIACLEEAGRRDLPPALFRQWGRLLSTAYKRAGRTEEAVALWKRLATQDGLSPWAHVELAKHYEHRDRDLAAAREWTLRAVELVRRRRRLRAGFDSGRRGGWTAPGRDEFGGRELDELLHRLRRIDRKLGGASGQTDGAAAAD